MLGHYPRSIICVRVESAWISNAKRRKTHISVTSIASRNQLTWSKLTCKIVQIFRHSVGKIVGLLAIRVDCDSVDTGDIYCITARVTRHPVIRMTYTPRGCFDRISLILNQPKYRSYDLLVKIHSPKRADHRIASLGSLHLCQTISRTNISPSVPVERHELLGEYGSL